MDEQYVTRKELMGMMWKLVSATIAGLGVCFGVLTSLMSSGDVSLREHSDVKDAALEKQIDRQREDTEDDVERIEHLLQKIDDKLDGWTSVRSNTIDQLIVIGDGQRAELLRKPQLTTVELAALERVTPRAIINRIRAGRYSAYKDSADHWVIENPYMGVPE